MTEIRLTSRTSSTDEISSNHVGYALLRLLLRKFSGREHLDTTNHRGYTPIHYAVYHANVIALEIIIDHLASLGQELVPNFAGPGAPPPLDGIGQVRKLLLLKEEDQPHLYATLKQNTAKTYALMRNLGGCRLWEREGAPIEYELACCPGFPSCTNLHQHYETCSERTQQGIPASLP